jgi:SET domain-containing protein
VTPDVVIPGHFDICAGTSPKLALRAVGRKGRGIFAAARIAAGELLETAPTVELDRHDTDTIVGTTLDNYYFAHPADPEGGLLVFGLASLINHADEPNTGTTPRHADGLGCVLELRALRDIAPGEELTRRYACELWFDPEPPA